MQIVHIIQLMKSSMFWDIAPCIPLTFNGLHAVISQKMELFITIAVRTSDPTNLLSTVSHIVFDKAVLCYTL
jgi:hypothetical protein